MQSALIILFCLADIGILLTAILMPFLIRHNHGLKGTLTFIIYKNDKNELRCKCSGFKKGRIIIYDEICKKINVQKYSIRIYYKAFRFFRIPLTQLNKDQIETIKAIKDK